MILVLKRRIFHEINGGSLSIYFSSSNITLFLQCLSMTLQWRHMSAAACSFSTHRRFDWLINSLSSLTTKQYQSQRAALRVDSLTKGPWCGDLGCERVPITYACMSQQTHCLCSKSSGWHMKESCSLSRPDDLAIDSISSEWLMVNVLCHPGDIT